MKIGLFGGTFDPVHFEHVNLCRHAVKELQLDKLIVMPAGQPPHKRRGRPDKADRWNMCRLAFANLGRCELWNYELSKEGPSYSYLTLRHLRTIYPKDELFFVIGGDSLHDFFTWREPAVIASLCELAVARRTAEVNSQVYAAMDRGYDLAAALDAALWDIYGRGDAKAYAQACQDAARQAGWTVEDSVCTVEIPATEKLSLRVQATLLPFTEEAARLQLTGFATVSQSEEMEAFF